VRQTSFRAVLAGTVQHRQIHQLRVSPLLRHCWLRPKRTVGRAGSVSRRDTSRVAVVSRYLRHSSRHRLSLLRPDYTKGFQKTQTNLFLVRQQQGPPLRLFGRRQDRKREERWYHIQRGHQTSGNQSGERGSYHRSYQNCLNGVIAPRAQLPRPRNAPASEARPGYVRVDDGEISRYCSDDRVVVRLHRSESILVLCPVAYKFSSKENRQVLQGRGRVRHAKKNAVVLRSEGLAVRREKGAGVLAEAFG
jgi:hypothetical protein